MTIAVYLGDPEETSDWIELLSGFLPEFQVVDFDDPGDPDLVQYAVVWAPPAGGLAQFPNLKAIVSIGAGVDHVLKDPKLPRHVPILRTTGPDMVQRLREYVTLHVLAHHRQLNETDDNQRNTNWDQIVTPVAGKRRVGIMGLGTIAGECARTLSYLGFETVGWSRSRKQIEGVQTYAGDSELPEFLAGTDILVCLLPMTTQTEGILNADLFRKLSFGARLINAARGRHLVEDDFLAALESGQLEAATLDVFQVEPLPDVHPFWSHPKIRITPHIASMIDEETGAAVIAENIRHFDAHGSSDAKVDAARGY